MKKLLTFLLAPLLMALMTSSCDKIKNPVIVKTVVVGSKFITKTNKAYSNYRKVLLEDYTGHRCPNCPDAASIIKNSLTPRYKDTLIVLSVHAGFLAQPVGAYKAQSFTTTAGEAWNAYFSISSWPKGLINRKDYNNNGVTLEKNTWASVIPFAKADPFIVKMDMTTNYDTTARALNTDITAYFKKAYANPTKITVVYMEEGIVGMQDSSGIEVDNYEFEHMFRGVINDTWGSDLKTAAAAANDSVKVSFPGFSIPADINAGKGKTVNPKNVSVVAYIYDAVTREVLQAEKIASIAVKDTKSP